MNESISICLDKKLLPIVILVPEVDYDPLKASPLAKA